VKTALTFALFVLDPKEDSAAVRSEAVELVAKVDCRAMSILMALLALEEATAMALGQVPEVWPAPEPRLGKEIGTLP